jgi:hypothetical protein
MLCTLVLVVVHFISNAPLPILLETNACGFQSLIQAKMCDRFLSFVDSNEP